MMKFGVYLLALLAQRVPASSNQGEPGEIARFRVETNTGDKLESATVVLSSFPLVPTDLHAVKAPGEKTSQSKERGASGSKRLDSKTRVLISRTDRSGRAEIRFLPKEGLIAYAYHLDYSLRSGIPRNRYVKTDELVKGLSVKMSAIYAAVLSIKHLPSATQEEIKRACAVAPAGEMWPAYVYSHHILSRKYEDCAIIIGSRADRLSKRIYLTEMGWCSISGVSIVPSKAKPNPAKIVRESDARNTGRVMFQIPGVKSSPYCNTGIAVISDDQRKRYFPVRPGVSMALPAGRYKFDPDSNFLDKDWVSKTSFTVIAGQVKAFVVPTGPRVAICQIEFRWPWKQCVAPGLRFRVQAGDGTKYVVPFFLRRELEFLLPVGPYVISWLCPGLKGSKQGVLEAPSAEAKGKPIVIKIED